MRRALSLLALLTAAAHAPVWAGNWNVPTSAKGLRNPVKKDARSIRAGREIFVNRCSRCHGEDGKGEVETDVKVGYDLRTIMPGLVDGELFWKVTHGVGRMPSFAGTLSERERWLVINFMRTFEEPDKAKDERKSYPGGVR